MVVVVWGRGAGGGFKSAGVGLALYTHEVTKLYLRNVHHDRFEKRKAGV